MPRRSLVEDPALARNRFARQPKYNDLFRQCLRSDILPERSRNPRKFSRREITADLYLDVREWADDRIDARSRTKSSHELFLDDLFWNEKLRNPRICLIGRVGTGKSTLIDYYLRCYCPNFGCNHSSFERKLVLHFDARGVQDNHASYRQFYGQCKAIIDIACKSTSFPIDQFLRRRSLTANYQNA